MLHHAPAILRITTLAATLAVFSSPALASDIGGTYSAHGTNPNGSTYTGTVVVRPDGRRYHFSWLISNGDTYKGTGTRKDATIVVDWGAKHPVIYKIGADGVLHGKWDDGRASETLVPKR